MLCADRTIDLSAWCQCTSNKSVVFGVVVAALVKRNMKRIVT